MGYQKAATATPSTPPAGINDQFNDINNLNRESYIDPTGAVNVLTAYGWRDFNFIMNPEFQWIQRIGTALAAFSPTTALGWGGAFNTTGRFPSFDRWCISNSNNTTIQTQQVDTASSPEAGLNARYYCRLKQITNGAKICYSQCMPATETSAFRGKTIRMHIWARYSVCAAPPQQMRLGMLYLTSAGTVDAVPYLTNFITAWGANGTDPTWGANLVAPAPALIDGGTISGLGMSFSMTSAWVRYSATFAIPATALNVIPVVFTNNSVTANDDILLSQAIFTIGNEIKDYIRPPASMDYWRCLRFYQKTFPQTTIPAQNAGVISALRGMVAIAAAVSTSSVIEWQFVIPFYKTPPYITFFNPSAANAFLRNVPAATDATVTAAANSSEKAVMSMRLV